MLMQIQPSAGGASTFSDPCSRTTDQHPPAHGRGQEVQAKLLMEAGSMSSLEVCIYIDQHVVS